MLFIVQPRCWFIAAVCLEMSASSLLAFCLIELLAESRSDHLAESTTVLVLRVGNVANALTIDLRLALRPFLVPLTLAKLSSSAFLTALTLNLGRYCASDEDI